jgi:hypothetical protein
LSTDAGAFAVIRHACPLDMVDRAGQCLVIVLVLTL